MWFQAFVVVCEVYFPKEGIHFQNSNLSFDNWPHLDNILPRKSPQQYYF